MEENASDDEQSVKQDVQSWYSNDSDVGARGSDKSNNESDDVVVEKNNSDVGQLWQPEQQYWFPKSWFSYDTDVEVGNSAEGHAIGANDEIPRANDHKQM